MTHTTKKRFGTAIIISGPSGVGKSTLCEMVRQAMPELAFSVSCTTRPPRPGEIDGVHYHFVTQVQFKRLIAEGKMLEYACVFGNFYGTLRSEVEDKISHGQNVFLDIDVQGAMQIREFAAASPLLAKCCEFVFIIPSSLSELEERLRCRPAGPGDQLEQRLTRARDEINHWRQYDYLITNDQLETAAADLIALVRAMRLKTVRLPEDYCNE